MNVVIKPGQAAGILPAPPSKSMAHRLLICAGLSEGVSHIRGVELNQDIAATIDCLRALGAECTLQKDTVTVRGIHISNASPKNILHCRESGSTLRFFIPSALLCQTPVTLTGAQSLFSRPLSVYETLCDSNDFYLRKDGCTLEVGGCLKPGTFTIPGDVSSQFISGLLFALPLLDEDSTLSITPPVESRAYIDLTLQALRAFGVCAQWKDSCTLHIPGNQHYQATDMTVEGDYSGAAFFAALNALGNHIDITGLSSESLQGDKIYEQHFPALLAGSPTIDIADCPDLGPILFAVAAAKNGATFTGTRRLKIKESDRATAMAQELSAFGTQVTVNENSVVVCAQNFHRPDRILYGHNDHRIVMSLAVLLTLTGGEIRGAQAITKSFPGFFDRLRELGVEVVTYEADQ